jgi:serine/threonine protein kinase
VTNLEFCPLRFAVHLSNTPHPNIVKFIAACTEEQLMIVTELVSNGELGKMLLNTNIALSDGTRMRMAQDIALGMHWLHSSTPQIIHRDLKPSNLLVDKDLRIKICDFGFGVGRIFVNTKLFN